MKALRYIRQIAQETSGEVVYGLGRQPAVLRTFSQRLIRYSYDHVSFLRFIASDVDVPVNYLFIYFIFVWFFRGFNDAVNGFNDDGWSLMSCDGSEDVTVAVNSAKNLSATSNSANTLAFLGGVLCAKASMLLQVSLKTTSMSHD